MKNKSFLINYNDISVVVTRKVVKNISIRILPPNGNIKMSVPLFVSDDKIINIIKEKYEWIICSKDKIISKSQNEINPDIQLYRVFYNSFPSLLKKWEIRMGLNVSKFRLRVMKSCWGSCRSQTRALTFNLKLATKPLECVEYVIIHELAHIVHPNHNPEFWKLVEQYCPDYKRIRTLLKN